jgi:exopolysaccharide biosynthesis polyprenyl glycosylphosphotransferase
MNTTERSTTPATVLNIAPERPINLRARLVLVDIVMLSIAWLFVLFYGDRHGRSLVDGLLLSGVAVGFGVWQIHLNELYLARVSIVRSIELSRLVRSIAVQLAGVLIALRVYRTQTRIREVVFGAILGLILTLVGRSAFRAWLSAGRKYGRFVREVLIIGATKEAAELAELFKDHPEAGYRVAGVVGKRIDALSNGLSYLWKGEAEDAPAVLRGSEVSGVIIVVGALDTSQLNELVRELQAKGIHVTLSNGVRGINYRRLRAAPIAHEPLFYVEHPSLRRRELIMKRAMDIVISIFLLIVLSPLYLMIAAIIKLGDRGPVFFKQNRVGLENKHFMVWKFRTMVVDAEARLRELQKDNERSGPLFKMDRDPRITRVGNLLRETSLDELPQLINVIKGEMSLVGPRPALPSEVEQFDTRLLDRTKVLPGMTGLWQVEARDNPSFSAYRRLDLFYVDNWSISLDLVIMLATAEQVVAKAVRSLRRGSSGETATISQLPVASQRAA